MSSERRSFGRRAAAVLVVLGSATLVVSCADLDRGRPSPDAAAVDTGMPVGEAGAEGGPAARSFARDVHPLLIDGCARCHTSSGSASNTSFLLTDDAGGDLAGVARFINQENPAGSRLLSKGAGMGHGGGAIFAAGSPEHRTILEWISQGSAP